MNEGYLQMIRAVLVFAMLSFVQSLASEDLSRIEGVWLNEDGDGAMVGTHTVTVSKVVTNEKEISADEDSSAAYIEMMKDSAKNHHCFKSTRDGPMLYRRR